MDDPALYQQSNAILRQDEEKIIKQYKDMIQLRPDGKDTLIDIGCGPGDVLVDLIRAVLPKTHGTILGTDISPKMIEHARRQYSKLDRVEFEVLDIGVKTLPPEYREKFDHVTSFICLHWLQDQRQALRNIYDLMVPGGDCMLVFLGSHSVFDGYVHIAQDPRWAKYMFDLKEFIPVTQKIEDQWALYTKLFKEVGFVDEHIEVRQKAFVYHSPAAVLDHMAAVNAFIHRVPPAERKEFIGSLRRYYEEMGLEENGKYVMPHKLVVAYARKL